MSQRQLLSDSSIQEALVRLDGWHRNSAALVKTVELPSFPDAISVVSQVAEIAETDDHHPDIDIRWRTLTFSCSTHSSGGITELDVALAAKINQVLSNFL